MIPYTYKILETGNLGGTVMDQQTEKTMTVKDYKRAGRAEAAAYIKRRKET